MPLTTGARLGPYVPEQEAVLPVTRDGQRFLINTDASSDVIPVTIISDWQALLKQ